MVGWVINCYDLYSRRTNQLVYTLVYIFSNSIFGPVNKLLLLLMFNRAKLEYLVYKTAKTKKKMTPPHQCSEFTEFPIFATAPKTFFIIVGRILSTMDHLMNTGPPTFLLFF